MPEFIAPSRRVQKSYLEAAREHQAEGMPHYAALTVIGPPPRFPDVEYSVEELRDRHVFDGYVRRLAELSDHRHPIRPGFVHSTTLWWVEGERYLGRLSIRHALTERLRNLGGHIGYGVRPTARRQGHATAMLRAALPYARQLGLDPVLVTCDDDNVASRKVIEASRGMPDEPYQNKLRYWVPTSGVLVGDQ